MSNVVVLPNLPSRLRHFFGEVAGQHIPELLSGLEDYLDKTTKVIEQYPNGDQKSALMAQSPTIASLLEMARLKADRL
ncbi:hypothetical protein [Bradyrhizobium symbiodeficiens]|uniref:hypothetical protein n=1 Tax=Bradyrhizobium symbiodeficiens TaxID=1404367 RepID=UPI00140FEB92|nr:hypothetical protein [Bradyrhizobium symbiodeficiens]QIO98832.1 hypothetical protein HAU86_02980 [Bradyrhizobium symbiodeficiens]